MINFTPPAQLARSLVKIGEKKARLPLNKMFLLAILAGIYIGFAAHLATTVATGWSIGGEPALLGFKKFVVGAVFSVGLMLVIIPGSELWTGNCLMSIGLCEKKIKLRELLRNWLTVWLGNLVGSVFIAWLIAIMSGLDQGAVGSTAINIAGAKCNLPPMQMLVRGIAANWLVCLAVLIAYSAKDIAGKVLGIFFPIMAFVTSGYEHSIANMYFLPAGFFSSLWDKAAAGADQAKLAAITLENILTNIGLVTLGNFIGGSLMVGVTYWFLYVKDTEHPQPKKQSHTKQRSNSQRSKQR